MTLIASTESLQQTKELSVVLQNVPAAGKGKRGEEGIAEGPAWAAHMRPELTAVMRSLQQLSGAALGSPGMKPFRHLLGSFSPDALLALGKPHISLPGAQSW